MSPPQKKKKKKTESVEFCGNRVYKDWNFLERLTDGDGDGDDDDGLGEHWKRCSREALL